MSYQVLARKWRPRSFREMVGQEHVLQALINALDHDRLHHAYLFTGTRGVGKTTIARILAKCLNCEQGVSSEPCGQCSSCLEIAEGRSVDLLEVDAASRTKVEDTRELLDNVQYAPTRSRYKVYLIDEVHMLSNHSFNALLKTLEEPPPHVKFLLATTDPQKLPATILSRCLQFNLKNMPPEQIVGHLGHVLDKEMVSFEEPALWLLGRAAAGSMRDALSLTDQAIAFGAGAVAEADVRSMLGTVDMSFVYQVLEAVSEGDPAALLAVVARMAEHAPDFESSLDEMLSLLHRVAVAQVVPLAVDNSWGDAERVSALAAAMTAEDAQLYYQLALNGKRDVPLAADPRSGFEMVVLRMIAFRPALVFDSEHQVLAAATLAPAPDSVAGEVDRPPKKPCEATAVATPPQPAADSVAVAQDLATTAVTAAFPQDLPATASDSAGVPQDLPTTASASAAVPQDLPATASDSAAPKLTLAGVEPQRWPQLLEYLGLVGIVYNIASNCELRQHQQTRFEFVLDSNNMSLFNTSHEAKLRQALENYFATELSVTIVPGDLQGETPAQQQQRLALERQREAVAAIERDPLLQQLIERFDGELDRSSITPMDP